MNTGTTTSNQHPHKLSERRLVQRSNRRLARGVCGQVNPAKRYSRRLIRSAAPQLAAVLRRAAIRRSANENH